jgi:hypothetical protein
MFDIISNELHPIPFPVVDLIPGVTVFRARRNIGDEVFKEISSISSHSKTQDIEHFGRCNTPGQSTFYCAENRAVADMEVLNKQMLDDSKYIILTGGRWKIKKKLKMALLIHGEDAIKANPFIKQRYDDFQSFLSNSYPKQKDVINRLLEFFSNYFSRPFDESINDEYKLSAAFYNYVLDYIDGLIYPSVKIIYKGLNYAFSHERFIEDYIELDRALVEVMEKTSEENFQDIYFTEDRGIMKEVNFIRWHTASLPYNKLPFLN